MKNKTPICDFVDNYVKTNFVRFHMPAHKGKDVIGCEQRDITEIRGADSLYEASGIIAESENNASKLFGSYKTLYSAEGSSQCIRAMLYLASQNRKNGSKRAKIAASRNAHKVFALTAALLDIDVVWIEPDVRSGLCGYRVSADGLEKTLKEEENVSAVYVTSPDYLGNIADVRGLAEKSHEFCCPLLVDNAHGAYLKFLNESLHPLENGADLCCDSAHKTLPVLTGGAYLHISDTAPKNFAENAKDAMALFGSTSPSYLILQSLDKTNKLLFGGYADKIKLAAKKCAELKNELTLYGWTLEGSEPLKITLDAKAFGYDGRKLDAYLFEKGIMSEYADSDYAVLMISAENTDSDFEKLLSVLKSVPKKTAIEKRVFNVKAEKAMSMKEALFAPCEFLNAESACGRILASPTVSCPPAVPVLFGGEKITKEAVDTFLYYDITKVKVVK